MWNSWFQKPAADVHSIHLCPEHSVFGWFRYKNGSGLVKPIFAIFLIRSICDSVKDCEIREYYTDRYSLLQEGRPTVPCYKEIQHTGLGFTKPVLGPWIMLFSYMYSLKCSSTGPSITFETIGINPSYCLGTEKLQ